MIIILIMFIISYYNSINKQAFLPLSITLESIPGTNQNEATWMFLLNETTFDWTCPYDWPSTNQSLCCAGSFV